MDEELRDTAGRDGWNRARFDDDEAVASQVRRMERHSLAEREARVLDRYLTRTGAETLDLGCGAGRMTRALLDRGLSVTGVDVGGTLVRAARSRLPGAAFATGDAATLPFDADAFDYVVFAYNGLDYLVPASERRAALLEVRRVLRPSGTFVFSSHNAWYALPALVADRGYLVDKYLRRANRGRLLDRYKFEATDLGDLETHFTTPPRQRRELRATGFDPIALVGDNPFPAALFETSPYYVAVPA